VRLRFFLRFGVETFTTRLPSFFLDIVIVASGRDLRTSPHFLSIFLIISFSMTLRGPTPLKDRLWAFFLCPPQDFRPFLAFRLQRFPNLVLLEQRIVISYPRSIAKNLGLASRSFAAGSSAKMGFKVNNLSREATVHKLMELVIKFLNLTLRHRKMELNRSALLGVFAFDSFVPATRLSALLSFPLAAFLSFGFA
jgi:hypothetical protein